MSNLLFALAILFVVIWAIGFLGYNIGGVIHILLVIAVITILLRIIKGDKIFK